MESFRTKIHTSILSVVLFERDPRIFMRWLGLVGRSNIACSKRGTQLRNSRRPLNLNLHAMVLTVAFLGGRNIAKHVLMPEGRPDFGSHIRQLVWVIDL